MQLQPFRSFSLAKMIMRACLFHVGCIELNFNLPTTVKLYRESMCISLHVLYRFLIFSYKMPIQGQANWIVEECVSKSNPFLIKIWAFLIIFIIKYVYNMYTYNCSYSCTHIHCMSANQYIRRWLWGFFFNKNVWIKTNGKT